MTFPRQNNEENKRKKIVILLKAADNLQQRLAISEKSIQSREIMNLRSDLDKNNKQLVELGKKFSASNDAQFNTLADHFTNELQKLNSRYERITFRHANEKILAAPKDNTPENNIVTSRKANPVQEEKVQETVSEKISVLDKISKIKERCDELAVKHQEFKNFLPELNGIENKINNIPNRNFNPSKSEDFRYLQQIEELGKNVSAVQGRIESHARSLETPPILSTQPINDPIFVQKIPDVVVESKVDVQSQNVKTARELRGHLNLLKIEYSNELKKGYSAPKKVLNKKIDAAITGLDTAIRSENTVKPEEFEKNISDAINKTQTFLDTTKEQIKTERQKRGIANVLYKRFTNSGSWEKKLPELKKLKAEDTSEEKNDNSNQVPTGKKL